VQAPRLTPSRYRRITAIAVVFVAVIIVTGGAVRLSGSGLGCPDWPTCKGKELIGATAYHARIESANRLFTGAVSVAVILAVLGALVRQPKRRDLTWLSIGLVGGVVAQIVLGGLTVLFKLRPPFVMAHFLLSMLLLADAVVLHHRAGQPDDGTRRAVVPRELVLMGRVVVVCAAVAIFLGTVVTGSGPHGGDEHVERLPFLVPDVARAHGTSVMLFLVVTLLTIWRLHRAGAPASLMRAAELLVAVTVAQAAVGYVQYFTGVPVILVGIHIAGAAAVWSATLNFFLRFTTRESGAAAEVAGASAGAPDGRSEVLAHPRSA
jgi:cytochrome c oxidase assembly protein subunit 15